jgi:hypothetical protein
LGSSTAACWSVSEALLIQLCDRLRVDTTVPAQLWLALREHFTELALLELLMLSGFYRTVSTLTNALELPLEAWAARFPTTAEVPAT